MTKLDPMSVIPPHGQPCKNESKCGKKRRKFSDFCADCDPCKKPKIANNMLMPKISVEYKSFCEDDAEKWQADAIFSDGRNYHAIASTPFEALRRLASFWEGRHERDTLPSKRPRCSNPNFKAECGCWIEGSGCPDKD